MLPIDSPRILLSFVAGPAVLANVRTILQNGVKIRHDHSVDQWRNLQSLRAGQGGKAAGVHSDTGAATVIRESVSARAWTHVHLLSMPSQAQATGAQS